MNSTVRRYMKPPPEVERFNENIVYDTKSRRSVNKNLKQNDLEMMMNMSQDKKSIVSKSNRPISDFKFKARLPDQSTIKTQEILKLINGVNFLSEKQEQIRRADNYSQMAVQENNNDPLSRTEAALNVVNHMLSEEGMNFDQEKSGYVDEQGNLIDLDI